MLLKNNMLGQPLGGGLILGKPRDFRLTVDTTGSIDPIFTAASLADEDFVWTKPDGSTFIRKAPANADFDSTGEYVLRCTDWTGITSFSMFGDLVSGDVSKWGFLLPFLTGSFNSASTNISGDISAWDLSNLTISFSCASTNVDYDSIGSGFSTVTNAITISMQGCGMSSTQVDNMLIDCDASSVADWGNKVINVSGTNTAPGVTGLAAETSLESKNAIVTITGE